MRRYFWSYPNPFALGGDATLGGGLPLEHIEDHVTQDGKTLGSITFPGSTLVLTEGDTGDTKDPMHGVLNVPVPSSGGKKSLDRLVSRR